MIRYALCCDEGHRFESWFYDSAAFDAQSARGLVLCPSCDSPHVVKAIMAPAVLSASRSRRAVRPEAPDSAGQAASGTAEPTVVPDGGSKPLEVALVDDDRRRMARAFRDQVLAETRDVGWSFAAEARRIHGSETDERIRGQATLAEARDLYEDGIMVLPLPALPDDLN